VIFREQKMLKSKFYTYNGRTQNLSQWSRELQIPLGTLHSRLKNSSFEEAVLMKKNTKKYKNPKYKDLLNQKFGKLKVLKLDRIENNIPRWLCECDCGNKKVIRSGSLISKNTKSCGCSSHPLKKTTSVGQKIGNILILSKEYLKKHDNSKMRKYVDVKCCCGCEKTRTILVFNLFKFKENHCIFFKHENIINKKFNMLTCIKFLRKGENEKGDIWLFRCDCGKEVEFPLGRTNNQKSCGCYQYRLGKENSRFLLYKEIPINYFHGIKRGAERRNILFNISPEEIWNLFIQQNKKCKFTSIDLKFHNSTKFQIEKTASLDRIDSKKGYTIDNICWIHKELQSMKRDYSNEYFIDMCILVNNFLNKKDSNFLYKKYSLPNKSSKISSTYRNYKGYKELSLHYYNNIIRGAKYRKIQFQLSIEDVYSVFEKQNGFCSLSGVPLIMSAQAKIKSNCSLDRIDSKSGYLINNIQYLYTPLNMMKNNKKQEDFIKWCKLVADNNPEF
jgi:hypothetical protein